VTCASCAVTPLRARPCGALRLARPRRAPAPAAQSPRRAGRPPTARRPRRARRKPAAAPARPAAPPRGRRRSRRAPARTPSSAVRAPPRTPGCAALTRGAALAGRLAASLPLRAEALRTARRPWQPLPQRPGRALSDSRGRAAAQARRAHGRWCSTSFSRACCTAATPTPGPRAAAACPPWPSWRASAPAARSPRLPAHANERSRCLTARSAPRNPAVEAFHMRASLHPRASLLSYMSVTQGAGTPPAPSGAPRACAGCRWPSCARGCRCACARCSR